MVVHTLHWYIIIIIPVTSLISISVLDILPASYSTVLYFSMEEMQELKGSPAFGRKFSINQQLNVPYFTPSLQQKFWEIFDILI